MGGGEANKCVCRVFYVGTGVYGEYFYVGTGVYGEYFYVGLVCMESTSM